MGTLDGVEGQYVTESKQDREPLLQQNAVMPSINQEVDSARDIGDKEDGMERHVKMGDSAEDNPAQQSLKKQLG